MVYSHPRIVTTLHITYAAILHKFNTRSDSRDDDWLMNAQFFSHLRIHDVILFVRFQWNLVNSSNSRLSLVQFYLIVLNRTYLKHRNMYRVHGETRWHSHFVSIFRFSLFFFSIQKLSCTIKLRRCYRALKYDLNTRNSTKPHLTNLFFFLCTHLWFMIRESKVIGLRANGNT